MADMIAGVCYFNADGQNYALVGEASYTVSGFSRESLMGADGFHGAKQKPAPGAIKAKIRNQGSVSLKAIAGWTDITVQLELANGKNVIGTGMFMKEPPTADAEEAEIEIDMEGPSVVEA
jgi:hypothetical protein